MIKTKIYRLFFLFLALSTFVAIDTDAQTIQQIVIHPANRINIYFDTMPEEFTSSLSENKKKINLLIDDTNVIDSVRKVTSSGVVKNVYVQTRNTNLEINIELDAKRGYTILPIPNSSMIMIDVFEWNKLSKAEDSYREAIFALETDLEDIAVKHLEASIEKKHANSSALLALINHKNADYISAVDHLILAYITQSNIPQVYSTLSNIYFSLKDSVRTEFFRKKYKDLSIISDVSIDSTKDYAQLLDSVSKEKLLGLKLVNISQNNSVKQDSSSAFTKLFPQDDTTKSILDSESNSLTSSFWGLPWWMEYLILIIIAIILLVVYFYLKWRNEQMALLNEAEKPSPKKKVEASAQERSPKEQIKEKEDFNAALQKAKNDIPKKIPVDLDRLKRTYQQDNKVQEEKPKTSPKQVLNASTNKSIDNIDKLLNAIQKKPIHLPGETVEKKEEVKAPQNLSAQMELAMHLARESRKQKTKNIDKLSENNLTNKHDNLEDIAKQMGLEKNSLETQQNLKDLLDDEDAIDKLAKKFNPKKDEE